MYTYYAVECDRDNALCFKKGAAAVLWRAAINGRAGREICTNERRRFGRNRCMNVYVPHGCSTVNRAARYQPGRYQPVNKGHDPVEQLKSWPDAQLVWRSLPISRTRKCCQLELCRLATCISYSTRSSVRALRPIDQPEVRLTNRLTNGPTGQRKITHPWPCARAQCSRRSPRYTQ